MNKWIRSIILPILFAAIIGGLFASVSYFVYTPIVEENKALSAELASQTAVLADLQEVSINRAEYEEELLSYKETLRKYYTFAMEYGNQPKLFLMLHDIERRVDVELESMAPADDVIELVYKATYKRFLDLLREFERIEYFYTCLDIKVFRQSGDTFSLIPDPVPEPYLVPSMIQEEEPLTVIVTASFTSTPVSPTLESEIDQLLKALGLIDVVIIE